MPEAPKRNEEAWTLALGFKDSWAKYKTEAISEAMTAFDRCKRAIPPEPLPAKMHDHKLDGPFKGYMECHLDDDVLLIYKPVAGGTIGRSNYCAFVITRT
jgi:addiction module RelE/StbE family toxin